MEHSVRYEIFDIDGRLLFRTDDIDADDHKRLERVEELLTIPAGATILTYLDGAAWPARRRRAGDGQSGEIDPS
jgi:hypothetical protein